MNCQEKSRWCTDKNVKLCQMKSGRNVYAGAVVAMCEECRKYQNGQFKLVKDPTISHEKKVNKITTAWLLENQQRLIAALSHQRMSPQAYELCEEARRLFNYAPKTRNSVIWIAIKRKYQTL